VQGNVEVDLLLRVGRDVGRERQIKASIGWMGFLGEQSVRREGCDQDIEGDVR
jgi:hypothetical protein